MRKLIAVLIMFLLATQIAYANPTSLSDELYQYISNESTYWEVPPALILAIVDCESGFRPNLVSVTNDYGLMQINKVNHRDAYNCFGFTNMLDPKQNLSYGIYKISILYKMYPNDIHMALMVYNQGGGGAKRSWGAGIYSSEYSRKIVAKWTYYEDLLKQK